MELLCAAEWPCFETSDRFSNILTVHETWPSNHQVDLRRLSSNERKRITSETAILKRLKHPHIINFYDSWVNPLKEQVILFLLLFNIPSPYVWCWSSVINWSWPPWIDLFHHRNRHIRHLEAVRSLIFVLYCGLWVGGWLNALWICFNRYISRVRHIKIKVIKKYVHDFMMTWIQISFDEQKLICGWDSHPVGWYDGYSP